MRSWDDEDETSRPVQGTTSDNTSSRNLQALEGGEIGGDGFSQKGGINLTLITMGAAADQHAPMTHAEEPEPHLPMMNNNYDDMSNERVQDQASAASSFQLSSQERKQQRADLNKSTEKKGPRAPQRRSPAKDKNQIEGGSTTGSHDRTFPGAVSVEGTTFNEHRLEYDDETLETMTSTPTHGTLPPQPHSTLTYAAVAHVVVDHDENAPIHHRIPSLMALMVEKREHYGISSRSIICASCIFFLATIIVAIAVAVALTTRDNANNTPFEYYQSAIKVTRDGGGPDGDPNQLINGGSAFDHLAEFGYLVSREESRIDKITELQVFVTEVCSTNNDCSLPTSLVLSLVVSYRLHNCSMVTRTQGAYTDGNFTPRATIKFPRDVFLTRIELGSEYISICDSTLNCTQVGPYNGTEPNVVLERYDSTIKAFYGFSGSWLDAVGVYYENNGQSTSNCD